MGTGKPVARGRGCGTGGSPFWFWTKRGLFEEGERWLARAADVPAPAWVRARTLIGLAHMQDFQGRHSETVATATQALALGRQANAPMGDLGRAVPAIPCDVRAGHTRPRPGPRPRGEEGRRRWVRDCRTGRSVADSCQPCIGRRGPQRCPAAVRRVDSTCTAAAATGGGWRSSFRLRRAFAFFETTLIMPRRRLPRRSNFPRRLRTRAAWPGVSRCLPACSQPKVAAMPRRESGARPMRCSRRWVVQCCRPSGGYAIATSNQP